MLFLFYPILEHCDATSYSVYSQNAVMGVSFHFRLIFKTTVI